MRTTRHLQDSGARVRRSRLLVLGVAALTVLACGGDDDEDGPSIVEDARGADESGDSGDAWSDADLERLIGIEVDGFSNDGGAVSDFGNATVSYLEESPDGPVALRASVTLSPCDAFICFDLAAEPDDQQLEGIRSTLSRVHLDNPDLVEDIGATELAGRDALAFYFRSFVGDDTGTATVNSYTAVVHDGANVLRIQVTPDLGFEGAQSADELADQMDADRGAELAELVLEAFDPELS